MVGDRHGPIGDAVPPVPQSHSGHPTHQVCCGSSPRAVRGAAAAMEEMRMATSDFDQFVEQYHLALDEFFRGNPEPTKMLYSHREDASLANPFGPVASGWKQVA